MQVIQTERGELVQDNNRILEEQKRFYSKLYSKDVGIQIENIEIKGRKLDQTQKIILDSEVTLEELAQALKEMMKCKASGPDGIPAEFYKVFWAKLKNLFLEVVGQVKKD